MTENEQLYSDQSEEAQNKSRQSKKKKNVEEQGSNELREASMLGLVPRETLTDITQLEDSSIREKQGQK